MGVSFYGGGGAGSGGVSNYNELSNKPITNLNAGSGIINLATLAVGLYSITGNYIYTAVDADTKHWASANFVEVTQEAETGNKVIVYDLYAAGKRTAYTIIYTSETEYSVKTFDFESINSNASTTEELPTTGDPSSIYSTQDGVYVWNDATKEYVQLGSAEAASDTWSEEW